MAVTITQLNPQRDCGRMDVVVSPDILAVVFIAKFIFM